MSYVVSSVYGNFIFPVGMTVETIGIVTHMQSHLKLAGGKIAPNGVFTKYILQTSYGMSFIQGVRHNIFKSDIKSGWLLSELEKNIKAERYIIPNREIFMRLSQRKMEGISSEYLLGLLCVPSVRELVEPIIEDIHSESVGEIVAVVYDSKDLRRVYEVTNTFNNKSVYFTLESKFPVRLLKQLGSISNSNIISVAQEDNTGNWTIQPGHEVESLSSYYSEIIKELRSYSNV